MRRSFLSGLGSVADWLVGVTVRCYVYLIRGNDEAGRPGWPESMKKYGVLRSQPMSKETRNWRCGWETGTAGDATGWQRLLITPPRQCGLQTIDCLLLHISMTTIPATNKRASTDGADNGGGNGWSIATPPIRCQEPSTWSLGSGIPFRKGSYMAGPVLFAGNCGDRRETATVPSIARSELWVFDPGIHCSQLLQVPLAR